MPKTHLEYEVGAKVKASKISYSQAWGPPELMNNRDEAGNLLDECDGHTWEESWKWLRDECRPADIRYENRVYLIVYRHGILVEVWETKRNHYEALATLLWKYKEEPESPCTDS